MDNVAVIGEEARIQGYALAGATLYPAEDADAVRTAWGTLPAEVAVVILTAAADAALADRDPTAVRPLVTVMDPVMDQ
jgi:vacuolar-type H+-ATPase subunit F/Vma7